MGAIPTIAVLLAVMVLTGCEPRPPKPKTVAPLLVDPLYGKLLPFNQFSKSRIDCSKKGRYAGDVAWLPDAMASR